MNCRTNEKRKNIMVNYDVEAVAHMQLLNGKIIHGDAGREINENYFIFKCVEKATGNIELIYCGRSVAKNFCEMIGCDLPKIFNPLHMEGNGHAGGGNNVGGTVRQWNKTRTQLYNAVMLLIAAWEAVPNTPLFDIKAELETYVNFEPFLPRIKAINTMLKNRNTTMRGVLDKLAEQNDIRNFQFDLLVNKLIEEGIDQYYE